MKAHEIGLGLFLVGLAAIIMFAVGSIISSPETPSVIRYGVTALFAGLLILFGYVVRDRLNEVGE